MEQLLIPGKELLPIIVNRAVLEKETSSADFVPLIVTSTKPDFYKQAPLFSAFERRGLPSVAMHTGQHFDSLLGHGLDEFGIRERIGIDLQIRGGLSEKTAEVVSKLKVVAEFLEKNFPGKVFLPIVHGDTHAAGIVPLGWMFATNQKCAQNEAGLRAMQPSFKSKGDFKAFFENQLKEKNWSINRTEPFPEQYDTFIGGAACHYHFAPVGLNRENLAREGYPEKNAPVVGNSVVEAFRAAMKMRPTQSVFSDYPVLEDGEWMRVDIHRRENLLPGRFRAIIGALKRLVASGQKVVFIEMNANKFAIERLGLRSEIDRLKTRKNFLYTGLWREYSQVVEFLGSGHCSAELTDSGSMQEELNELKKPLCLTCRFSTDRPESVFSGRTNFLVPPISAEYLAGIVRWAVRSERVTRALSQGKRLYGKEPSRKIASFLQSRREEFPFEWAHERAGVKYRGLEKGTFL